MSILDVVRAGVKVADSVTKPLQAEVAFSRMVLSGDGYGTKTYPVTVQMRAIVDWKQKQLRTTSGVLSVCRASIMFLSVADVVAATEGQGISDEDRIVLPDGTTGPILDMSGFIDAGTGHPVATEVFIG